VRTKVYTTTKKIFGNGAWSWFSDPRAVRYVGSSDKTYIGYVNSSGDVIVSSYDNANGTTVNFTLKSAYHVDDHINPAILIRPDGKIQCFYSKHSNGDTILSRISSSAEDISAFDSEFTVYNTVVGAFGVAYVNPVYLSAEAKYYLFWRAGDRSQYYATSTDGITWSGGAEMLGNSPDRPYLKYTSNGVDRIDFCYTNGHPNEETNSIYHVYYKSGNFYKTDGTLIKAIASLPLAVSDGTRVYDGTTTNSWNWDIATDANGYPVIVFATFPTTSDHRYWYGRWNGTAWVVNQITPAGQGLYAAEIYYSAGISLDHDNPSIVYLSKKYGNSYRLYQYETLNNGASWTKELITESGGTLTIRPVSINNHGSNLKLLYLSGTYATYTSFATEVVGLKRI